MAKAKTVAQLRKLLTTKLAVSASIAAEALNIGKIAFDAAVARGAVPTVDLGKGAKRKPIPTAWIRQQLKLEEAQPAKIRTSTEHQSPAPE